MDQELVLAMAQLQQHRAEESLRACNWLTQPYGLTLSETQIRAVAEERGRALRGAGRVEFGEGILKQLILAFCDSPNLGQWEYAQTLIDLQEEFYLRKNQSPGLTDDALLAQMRRKFDGLDREDLFRQDYGVLYGDE